MTLDTYSTNNNNFNTLAKNHTAGNVLEENLKGSQVSNTILINFFNQRALIEKEYCEKIRNLSKLFDNSAVIGRVKNVFDVTKNELLSVSDMKVNFFNIISNQYEKSFAELSSQQNEEFQKYFENIGDERNKLNEAHKEKEERFKEYSVVKNEIIDLIKEYKKNYEDSVSQKIEDAFDREKKLRIKYIYAKDRYDKEKKKCINNHNETTESFRYLEKERIQFIIKHLTNYVNNLIVINHRELEFYNILLNDLNNIYSSKDNLKEVILQNNDLLNSKDEKSVEQVNEEVEKLQTEFKNEKRFKKFRKGRKKQNTLRVQNVTETENESEIDEANEGKPTELLKGENSLVEEGISTDSLKAVNTDEFLNVSDNNKRNTFSSFMLKRTSGLINFDDLIETIQNFDKTSDISECISIVSNNVEQSKNDSNNSKVLEDNTVIKTNVDQESLQIPQDSQQVQVSSQKSSQEVQQEPKSDDFNDKNVSSINNNINNKNNNSNNTTTINENNINNPNNETNNTINNINIVNTSINYISNNINTNDTTNSSNNKIIINNNNDNINNNIFNNNDNNKNNNNNNINSNVISKDQPKGSKSNSFPEFNNEHTQMMASPDQLLETSQKETSYSPVNGIPDQNNNNNNSHNTPFSSQSSPNQMVKRNSDGSHKTSSSIMSNHSRSSISSMISSIFQGQNKSSQMKRKSGDDRRSVNSEIISSTTSSYNNPVPRRLSSQNAQINRPQSAVYYNNKNGSQSEKSTKRQLLYKPPSNSRHESLCCRSERKSSLRDSYFSSQHLENQYPSSVQSTNSPLVGSINSYMSSFSPSFSYLDINTSSNQDSQSIGSSSEFGVKRIQSMRSHTSLSSVSEMGMHLMHNNSNIPNTLNINYDPYDISIVKPVLFYVRVLFDYNSAIYEEISVRKDMIIPILETQEDGWWEGEIEEIGPNGKRRRRGLLPSNFVEIIKKKISC